MSPEDKRGAPARAPRDESATGKQLDGLSLGRDLLLIDDRQGCPSRANWHWPAVPTIRRRQ